MIYKKTEINASIDQKKKFQMKLNEDQVQQNQDKQKQGDGIQFNQSPIQPKTPPTSNRMNQDFKRDSDLKPMFRQSNLSGVNSSKQGAEMQSINSYSKQLSNNSQQKKSSYISQVQGQYSKIKSPLLTEILSDENDPQAFTILFIIILAFLIEQSALQEFTTYVEYTMIVVLTIFCIIQFILLYYQKYKYLHILQIVNSFIIVIIIGMWIYISQNNRQAEINHYVLKLSIYSDNSQANSVSDSNQTSDLNDKQEKQNQFLYVKNDLLSQIIQYEAKFFFQGAILYRLQECLNKHLKPKFRLFISSISTVAVLALFYEQQFQINDRLDYDIGIKCLFYILILIIYEQSMMKSLCSYLISFQALKKYFTLSLCSRNCLGFSNNIQIEINPENLSFVKVIQGNHHLSQQLLTDSMRFFCEFEIDPQSITNYNKVDQQENTEEKTIFQNGQDELSNFNFRTSSEKIKINNIEGSLQHQRKQIKHHTVSKQFIDKKILKNNSTTSFNKKRNSKMSHPTIVSLKRISQMRDNKSNNEGENGNNQNGINTQIGVVKSDNLLQTFRNNQVYSSEIGTKHTQIPYTQGSNLVGNPLIQQEPNSARITQNTQVKKYSIIDEENPIQTPLHNDKFYDKSTNQRFSQDNKNDNYLLQDYINSRTPIASKIDRERRSVSNIFRHQTLKDIINDPQLRSVQIAGKFKNNEQSKVLHLQITLLKYENVFEKDIIIANITDITSIQEINNLQKEVKFKESMFANVTHDLRTPLYAIKYSVDQLKQIFQIHQCNTLHEQREQMQLNIKDLQENDVKDLHEQINITVANTHLMEAIIQDIIDNNRNRMGKLEADVRQFNLMEMLLEMNKLMEIILWEKRKNIKIRFDICKSIKQNSMIYSDSQRLNNSIKFTKRGGIVIKVSKVFIKDTKNVEKYLNIPFKSNLKQKISELLEKPDISANMNTSLAEQAKVYVENQQFQLQQDLIFSQGLIQFQIIDSGVGMNSKILKNLFTPYNTFNNENMNSHGIGLGLTICKTIVEKLGPFQLKVASKEQRGSKFTFYIYHELQQSIIPQKLELISSIQKKTNISQNNIQHDLSHMQNPKLEEDQIISPRSYINLIPQSDQNLKSELFFENGKSKQKSNNKYSSNTLSNSQIENKVSKRSFRASQNVINQIDIDLQSQVEQNKKQNNQGILQVQNGRIIQFNIHKNSDFNDSPQIQKDLFSNQISIYFNKEESNKERINKLDSFVKKHVKTEDLKIEDLKFDQLMIKSEKQLQQNSKQEDIKKENEQQNALSMIFQIQNSTQINNGLTINHNNINNETESLQAKSPNFVSFHNQFVFNNQSTSNIPKINNNQNNDNNECDSLNKIQQDINNSKSNYFQKVSFGISIKKNSQIVSQNLNQKKSLNISDDLSDKDIFENVDRMKKRETEWQVPLSQKIENNQNQSFNQIKLAKETTDFLMPISQTQNASSVLNSTISSIVIGQKTANEKIDNEVQQNLTQQVQLILDFTASRARINSNGVKQIEQIQTKVNKTKQNAPNKFFLDDNLIPPRVQTLNSPIGIQSQALMKKIQNRSFDQIKQLKTEVNEQNNYLNKPQQYKNQEIFEYLSGGNNDSSIINPFSQGHLPCPSNGQSLQNKITNLKSQSKVAKTPSQNTVDLKCDQFIDDNYLEEDELFNSSILLSLEDNQEHINQEESNANHFIKNNLFQVMNQTKKSSSPKESNLVAQKSVRESIICSIERKGLFISKIDRQNHVTNHKMTDSVQLNQIKKFKFGNGGGDTEEIQDLQTLNALIVDDSTFNILILQKLLLKNKKYKMVIDTCLSGEEAIEKFLVKNKPDSKEPYNFIFLDWNMPIMDGYETSSKIKFYVKDEQYLDCPIIICTAYEDTTEINKCLRNGTDAILTKPISLDLLNDLISDFQQSTDYIRK